MLKNIIIYFFLISLPSYLLGQNDFIMIPTPIDNGDVTEICNNEISINSFVRENNFIVEISNCTSDTIYLFDSYLHPGLIKSKYLYRYNADANECRLSTLPLIPYLSVKLSDVIILGEEKIIKKYKNLYSFTSITPYSKVNLEIPIDEFNTNYGILDFDVKTKGSFDEIDFEKVKTEKVCSDIILELAIYKDVSLLLSKQAYYFEPEEFDEQAKLFNTFKILLSFVPSDL